MHFFRKNIWDKIAEKSPIRSIYSFYLPMGIAFLACLGMTSVANSTTYYIAPNGTNSNYAGTIHKPWDTFSYAIPRLKPSDTLILKNGTYNHRNSGLLSIDCTRGAKNGTSANPITIKAQNERKALIDGGGQWGVFRMLNCSHWRVEGLQAKSRDNQKTPRENVVYVYNSNNLMFKRLLLSHNNRYGNSHLLLLWNSNNVVVEESEFYSFHRHAINLNNANNNIIRRNYFNSRGRKDISDGFKSLNRYRGDMGITIYPGSNNIVENNISEGNVSIADIQATNRSEGNKFLGNISNNDLYGLVLQARGIGSNKMPKDTIIENHAVIAPYYYGILARGAKNTQAKNISILGGSSGIVADFEKNRTGDGIYSFFSTNAMVRNISVYGFRMVSQSEFSHNFPNSNKHRFQYSPNYNYFNEVNVDPNLGSCKVFIPRTSYLKSKGKDGEDIGANVLYRYQDGKISNQLLWNSNTGNFPHGAQVSGINNISGHSAYDVHKRLNVNANGCTLNMR